MNIIEVGMRRAGSAVAGIVLAAGLVASGPGLAVAETPTSATPGASSEQDDRAKVREILLAADGVNVRRLALAALEGTPAELRRFLATGRAGAQE